jgi:hypothetical protein
MKYLILLSVFLLSACGTTVPVKRTFPEAPSVLLEKCADLKKVKENAQLSDVMKTVTENYALYHECSSKHDSFVEWYKIQKQTFEGVGK